MRDGVGVSRLAAATPPATPERIVTAYECDYVPAAARFICQLKALQEPASLPAIGSSAASDQKLGQLEIHLASDRLEVAA